MNQRLRTNHGVETGQEILRQNLKRGSQTGTLFQGLKVQDVQKDQGCCIQQRLKERCRQVRAQVICEAPEIQ